MTVLSPAEFDALRSRLMAVGYRLTGSVADAEDLVQEAWIRWQTRASDVVNPAAWLTTVVGRLALDRLRSAEKRREVYVGEWLPEPIVTETVRASDPLDAAIAGEDARCAAMAVMDRLSPEQRVAFVLHDAFDVPFAEIAGLLGTTSATARQHASRGRRRVAEAPPRSDFLSASNAVEQVASALQRGEVAEVAALLHPEVTFTGDADGKARTTRRTVVGAPKVARFLMGLQTRYGPNWMRDSRPVLVNGELGSLSMGSAAFDGYPARDPRITAVALDAEGRVCAIWDIANPAKFSASPLASEPRGIDLWPTELGTTHPS